MTSVDVSKTIAPKSDQLNADDMIAGPITITVTQVRGCDGDQPIAVHFEGDGGKPYKPCKSMRRVLVHAWGKEGREYVGKRMTIYCDPNVLFGGVKVGGIRISHMSHIDRPMVIPLTVTRAQRKPYEVKPLRAEVLQRPARDRLPPAESSDDDDTFPGDRPSIDVMAWADTMERNLPDYGGVDVMREDWSNHKDALKAADPERFKDLNQKIARRAAEMAGA